MTIELTMLFWAVVLNILQVIVAVILSAKQVGLTELAGNRDTFVPEGIAGKVPFKGPVSDTVHQLVGGIKSSMGYCGAENISSFPKKAKFIRITSSGMVESHQHDIKITKESPNYHKPKLK